MFLLFENIYKTEDYRVTILFILLLLVKGSHLSVSEPHLTVPGERERGKAQAGVRKGTWLLAGANLEMLIV